MSPEVLEREEVAVEQAQQVPEGFSGHVVPSVDFGRVALDSQFTGAASNGPFGPYFSQMENLDDMVLIYTNYAPSPVRGREVYVIVKALPWTFNAPEVLPEPCARIKKAAVPFALEAPTPTTEVAGELSLADVAVQMRNAVDLPVQDLGRMAGVGRRHYYNLLQGKAQVMKRSDDEARLRLLHSQLMALSDQLTSPASVRAAVLMPLPENGQASFFSVAETGDVASMKSAYDELAGITTAGAAVVDRLPPSGTFPPGDERWAQAADFVRDYRDVDE